MQNIGARGKRLMAVRVLFSRRYSGVVLVCLVCLLDALLLGVRAHADPDEFSGTNLFAGAVFLETGSGSALVRSNVAWSAPTNLTHPALVFAVGFATQEAVAPGEFFDSLTVTLRDAGGAFVAPVVTVDRLGTVFAPENPGGVQLAAAAIAAEALAVPPLPVPGAFASDQAALVLVSLPPALIGQSGTLRLSLFDNQDAEGSVGFVSHVRVVPGPGTLLALESSAAVQGPYAPEGGLLVRHARRSLLVPPAGFHRFFQLQSPVPTRIAAFELAGGNWLFHYTGGEAGHAPRLLSSAQAAGPYAEESGVAADVTGRTLRLPRSGGARFFRLRSELPLAIRRIELAGDNLVLRYE